MKHSAHVRLLEKEERGAGAPRRLTRKRARKRRGRSVRSGKQEPREAGEPPAKGPRPHAPEGACPSSGRSGVASRRSRDLLGGLPDHWSVSPGSLAPPSVRRRDVRCNSIHRFAPPNFLIPRSSSSFLPFVSVLLRAAWIDRDLHLFPLTSLSHRRTISGFLQVSAWVSIASESHRCVECVSCCRRFRGAGFAVGRAPCRPRSSNLGSTTTVCVYMEGQEPI
jgi:hypothetical protein